MLAKLAKLAKFHFYRHFRRFEVGQLGQLHPFPTYPREGEIPPRAAFCLRRVRSSLRGPPTETDPSSQPLKKSWQSWQSSIFTGLFAGLKLANFVLRTTLSKLLTSRFSSPHRLTAPRREASRPASLTNPTRHHSPGHCDPPDSLLSINAPATLEEIGWTPIRLRHWLRVKRTENIDHQQKYIITTKYYISRHRMSTQFGK